MDFMKPRVIASLAFLFINSLHISAQDRRIEVRPLAPSQTIEREMKGSETHAYLISLRRGEFMHVEVEQRGINVVVSLFARDGRKLVAMDNRQISYGTEPLSFAADAAGTYRLEVGAGSAKAINGRYIVRLNELRSVTASDRLRIAAERTTADGQRLRMLGTADSYRRALDLYQAALKSWREIGDRYWEATTLTNIGRVHCLLRENQAALEVYNQALTLSREVKDVSGEARILNNLGDAYDMLGDKQKALEFHNKALSIRRVLGDKSGEASTLIGIGNIYNLLGEKQKALGFYHQALPIYRTVGDKSGEGNALAGIGNVHDSLGEKQKALDFYNQALPIYRAAGDKSGEAHIVLNLGCVHNSLGEKEKALKFYTEALPIYRAVGDKSGEADTLLSLGVFYYSVGEKQKAMGFYNLALPIYRSVGDKSGEADTLNNLGNVYNSLGEKQRALEFYNQTLPIRRALGDKSGEAETLNNLGNFYNSLGEKQKALEFYNQALPIRRDVGDKSGEADTLNNLGAVFDSLGEKQKALGFYNQALPIYRAVSDKSGEATTLNNLGQVYDSLGEKQKALGFYNQALSIYLAVSDKSCEAHTLNNLGKVYDSLGQKQKAIEFYNQALPIYRAVRNKAGEADTLNNLGVLYHSLGEKQKALGFYNQALAIYRAVSDRSCEATTLNNLGNVYNSLGEKQKALEFYSQALPIKRAVGDKSGEATTLNNLGQVYDSLGEKEKALEFYSQALPIRRAVRDKSGEADTLINLGNIYSSLGKKLKSLEFYNQALPIYQGVGDISCEADTLNNLGAIYDSLGQKQRALAFYNKALPIYRAVGGSDGEALTLANLMLLSHKQGKPSLAVFYGKQSINLLQQLRANISGLEQRFQQSFLHSKEYAYRQLADILITQGRLLEAEAVLALLKDEEYASLRRRDHPKSSVGYSTVETEAVNALHRLGELGREAYELRDRLEKNVLDEKGRRRLDQILRELLPKANAEFRNTLAAIEQEAPGSVIKIAEAKESRSLQPFLREMGPGTVGLYTVVSTEAGKGWVILVTPDTRKAYEMDVAGLDQTVAAFRQTLLSDTYDPQPLAQKLYQMIFLKPQKQGNTLAVDLDAYLRDKKEKTLMWSLDGVLRYVPMAALHNGEKYLVENYRNVIFIHSRSINLKDPTSSQWNALGLGVSKQFEGFAALLGVPKELAAIVSDSRKRTRGVLPGTIKWDDEFSEQAMMDSLRTGYKVVHIASHFSYEAANPGKSFLLLGDGSHLEMDKFQDESTLFEKTDLVTLSACDTAVGGTMKDANGKDVEGFAYKAQELGAKAVIASLWPVDDVATQVLMPKFYSVRKSNPGMVKAEALRQATLSLLQGTLDLTAFDQSSIRAKLVSGPPGTGVAPLFTSNPKAPFAHPHYWAPFVLIGNWK
jgi:tetratricopeptide (TPR) repeat protein